VIEGKDTKRVNLHLIGKRGEKINGNANNRYQGRDIVLSLKLDLFERLFGEGYFKYLNRIESTKGEKKKSDKK